MFTEVITAPDPEKVLQILYRLVPFYACYSVSLVLQAAMISIGRTRYLLAESVIVNVLYYGTVYSLHLLGVFPQSMDFVIAMLGFGFVVGMIADAVFCVKTKGGGIRQESYRCLMKRPIISIETSYGEESPNLCSSYVGYMQHIVIIFGSEGYRMP